MSQEQIEGLIRFASRIRLDALEHQPRRGVLGLTLERLQQLSDDVNHALFDWYGILPQVIIDRADEMRKGVRRA
jgi:hypothetical protein